MPLLSEAENLDQHGNVAQASLTGQPSTIQQVPPSSGSIYDDAQTVGVSDPNPTLLENTPTSQSGEGPSLQDLYPVMPEVAATPTVDVATPTSSGSVDTDKSAAEVTDGAATSQLTDEQLADKDLARILEQDSPLMQRARTEAAQFSNRRGLMNSSMAAGATMGAMVDRALPMALQNAQQAFQRGLFNATQQNDISKLEAQLATALESQDAEAANAALRQIDAITRDAEAQQAGIDYAAGAETAAATNAFQSQVIDGITQLNQQYLQGTQAMDLANIQGSWQSLISTNEVAGSFWQAGINALGSIMSNPDMTPAQIASAAQNIIRQINGGLQMIGTINDIDFGDLMPGGGTTTPPGPGPGQYPYMGSGGSSGGGGGGGGGGQYQ
jgi:hypothetical protein